MRLGKIAILLISLFLLGNVVISASHPEIRRDRIFLKKNDDLKARLIKENAIYVIRYDFDLDDPLGEHPVVVPANCVIKFKGGSLRNGVLLGSNTIIDARIKQIFKNNMILSGTWDVKESYPEWFGAKGDGVTDDTKPIQEAINAFDIVSLRKKTYVCNDRISIGASKTIIGFGTTIKCNTEGRCQLFVEGDSTNLKGIAFENKSKGYPGYGYDNGGVNSTNVVYNHGIKGISIKHCSFRNAICGVYIHSGCKDIVIDGCKFNEMKSLPDDHLNPKAGCAGGYGICLDADNSDNKDIDNIYNVKIINCSFNNIQRHCLYIQCVYDISVDSCTFYANRNIIHPTPYDAVMMVYNTIDLRVSNNNFYDALEAMHLVKIGVLPYNSNELKNITIENNDFYNCGDDIGENGVIGADFGDYIYLTNNSFNNNKGLMGAIIGLNHNSNVVIENNMCVVSQDCPMNTNLIRYNSSDVRNIRIIGNTIDFSRTGKKYDKLLYTEYAADRIEVKDNIIISGKEGTVIDIPNITNKTVLNNVKTIPSR